MMYQSLKRLLTLIGVFLFATHSYAQFATPLVLSADNPTEQVTVTINDVSEVNFIRLLAYDPDFVDEG